MLFERRKIGFACLFMLIMLISGIGCGNKSTDLTARIVKVTGNVELRQPSAETFVVAKEDDLLACGGILKTGDGAAATMEIIGKGTVEVKSDASFELESGKDYVVQKAGAAVYKIEKNKGGFKVKSPQGVTCVLGTEFMVRVLEKMSVVGVVEGKVSFTTNKGEEKLLNAQEKVIADAQGFIGEIKPFDFSSDSFNYLKIDGQWVPKEATENR